MTTNGDKRPDTSKSKSDECGQDPKTGRFVRGNKMGALKPRKTPRTALRQLVTDEDVEEMMKQAVEKALEGDSKWQEFILSRTMAPVKAAAPMVHLDIDLTSGSTEDAMRQVLQKVADGAVSSDQAKDLLQSIAAIEQVAKLAELELKVRKLEEEEELPWLQHSRA